MVSGWELRNLGGRLSGLVRRWLRAHAAVLCLVEISRSGPGINVGLIAYAYNNYGCR